MIERHNELLRSQLHQVEGQLQREGLALTAEAILDECILAKNVMLCVHGVSPYKAVFGRVPNMLSEFEPISDTALDDDNDGIQGISRNVNRLREAALHSIVRGTAQDRIDRAMNSRTRVAGELLELQLGDSVDFHRDPPNKDMSGWSGPARVVDLSRLSEGTIGIEWQSRNFPCRVADLRRAVLYTCFLSTKHSRDYAQVPLQVLVDFAEAVEKDVLHFGLAFRSGKWHLTKSSIKFPLIMSAVYHVAACDLQLLGTIAAKVGHGVPHVDGIAGADDSLVIWWAPGRLSSWAWSQFLSLIHI